MGQGSSYTACGTSSHASIEALVLVVKYQRDSSAFHRYHIERDKKSKIGKKSVKHVNRKVPYLHSRGYRYIIDISYEHNNDKDIYTATVII